MSNSLHSNRLPAFIFTLLARLGLAILMGFCQISLAASKKAAPPPNVSQSSGYTQGNGMKNAQNAAGKAEAEAQFAINRAAALKAFTMAGGDPANFVMPQSTDDTNSTKMTASQIDAAFGDASPKRIKAAASLAAITRDHHILNYNIDKVSAILKQIKQIDDVAMRAGKGDASKRNNLLLRVLSVISSDPKLSTKALEDIQQCRDAINGNVMVSTNVSSSDGTSNMTVKIYTQRELNGMVDHILMESPLQKSAQQMGYNWDNLKDSLYPISD